ncbi:MAG: hypothetical protein R2771_07615 [Saprospiraceae bacterium]
MKTPSMAAERILSFYTGLDNIYLDQVYTYSEINRDPKERTVSYSLLCTY